VAAAVAAARQADVAVVCVGLPDGYENEGDDRTHLRLPPTHDALVAAVAAVHDRVVVVLSNGAPVEMPWVDDVEAVVEGYLGGQAGGGGLADVLTGRVDPSGHLAETFPRHLDDDPGSRHFPGGPDTVEHREGLYVGYRFHDTVGADVLFPFGHGLTYTTFEVGEVRLDRDEVAPDELADGGAVHLAVEVTNTGERAGRQVVQVYVRDPESCVYRPDRELRAFAKVALEPGETTTVDVAAGGAGLRVLGRRDRRLGGRAGRFEVLVGFSSRDLRGSAELTVTGRALPRPRRASRLPPPAALPRRRRRVLRATAGPGAPAEARRRRAVRPQHPARRGRAHACGSGAGEGRRTAAAARGSATIPPTRRSSRDARPRPCGP
jgi:beta-glucosidase